jgi:hypothetical protein
MSKQRQVQWIDSKRGLVLYAGLALAIGGLGAAAVAKAADDDARPVSTVAASTRQAPGRPPGATVEDRVRTLTLALDLDTRQQSQLTKVLENHAEQVRKAWNDSSVPAAYRVSATRIISDQTAEQIRALLTEEQRKKFNPPRQARDSSARPTGPSVEDWMKAAQPKAGGASRR